jgi:hypothetical protein
MGVGSIHFDMDPRPLFRIIVVVGGVRVSLLDKLLEGKESPPRGYVLAYIAINAHFLMKVINLNGLSSNWTSHFSNPNWN